MRAFLKQGLDATKGVVGDSIPTCSICGEDTTHNRESSFYGEVHRWGPSDHPFTPGPLSAYEDGGEG